MCGCPVGAVAVLAMRRIGIRRVDFWARVSVKKARSQWGRIWRGFLVWYRVRAGAVEPSAELSRPDEWRNAKVFRLMTIISAIRTSDARPKRQNSLCRSANLRRLSGQCRLAGSHRPFAVVYSFSSIAFSRSRPPQVIPRDDSPHWFSQ